MCSRCNAVCSNRHELNLHIREAHLQRGTGEKVQVEIENPEIKAFYDKYLSFIHDKHELGQPQSFYNWAIANDIIIDDLMNHAEQIYNDQSQSFKINMSFGLILQNIQTEDYRYYKAYSNSPLFERPLHISKKKHLKG